MNPSLELLENVLFSIVLNHDPLGSGNVANSYKESKTDLLLPCHSCESGTPAIGIKILLLMKFTNPGTPSIAIIQ
jgi:hypothetical protein